MELIIVTFNVVNLKLDVLILYYYLENSNFSILKMNGYNGNG